MFKYWVFPDVVHRLLVPADRAARRQHREVAHDCQELESTLIQLHIIYYSVSSPACPSPNPSPHHSLPAVAINNETGLKLQCQVNHNLKNYQDAGSHVHDGSDTVLGGHIDHGAVVVYRETWWMIVICLVWHLRSGVVLVLSFILRNLLLKR